MRTKIWNDGAPEGFIVFNYASGSVPAIKLPSADEVPTLVPNEIMSELMRGDADPCFSVEAIPFPAIGNGIKYGSRGIYERRFFDSIANALKKRAIPGSKFGHEWSGKCSDDLFLVGMKVVPNADDQKTGVTYLKHYIPVMGYSTPNDGLRRNARIHNIRYSIVAKPEYSSKIAKDGVEELTITGSLGGERNDAVDEGAMTQIVNSGSIPIDVDAVKALIDEGEIDTTTNIAGDNPIKNGRVYRSVLRRLASRASADDRSVLGEMLSAIDKSKNGRKTVETKEEALEILTNAISNSQVKKEDLAKALGIEMRNELDVSNAETMKALNAKLGDKPLERLDAILAENKKTVEDRVKNAVAEVCGPEKIKNAGGVDVDNPSYAYALKACNGLEGDALKNALEALKKDPVMVALNGQRADGNSQLNRIATGGSSESGNDSVDGIPTHKIGGK